MLKFGFFLTTTLDKAFYLSDFGSNLHHSKISDFLCCFNSSEFKVFSKLDDDWVEAKSKKQIFLKVIIDFHDNKTMFLRDIFGKANRSNWVLYLFFVELSHSEKVDLGVRSHHLCNRRLKTSFTVVDLELFITPSNVHKWLTVDISSFLLGELHLQITNFPFLGFSIRNILEDCDARTVLSLSLCLS